MNSIRERAGGVMIGVLVVAFGGLWALQDSGAFDTVGMGRDGRTIGTVDGIPIQSELFSRALQQQLDAYQQQGIPVSQALNRQIEDQVFNSLVDNAIVEREMDRLGVEVTDDEVFGLITGPTPDPLIAQIFPDGQGGVDRTALQQVVEDPQYAPQLQAIEEQVRRNRRNAKLSALIGASARVSEAEVQEAFVRQNRLASADLVALRYAAVPDDQVEVTDDDLRDYYREHRDDFERPATYRIEYVGFDKAPTAADSARATNELGGLASGFRSAPDPIAYARRNSFGAAVEGQFVGPGEIPAELATAVFDNPTAGRIVGPLVAGDQAILARITEVRDADDGAVKARHILFPTGGEAQALQVRQQIQNGETTFARAAQRHSIDESNKNRGGDLGWFGRGQMVGEFEEAAFAAPTGQIIGPVVTQFGVHLLEVLDRTNQEVELVQITRPVEGDYERVIEQAQDFVAFLELEDQDFTEAAQERGIAPTQLQVQEDQASIPGLDVGREFVRFLRRADEGTVSEPMDAGESFVVVRLLESSEEGVAPFEEVRGQIEQAVLLEKKKEVQLARLRDALTGATSFQAIAAAAGTQVEPVSDLSLVTTAIPGFGAEPRAVGAVFGLRPGQRSGIIEGDQAAFVVRTTSLVGGTDSELTAEARTQLRQELLRQKRQRILRSWLQGLRDEADVEDFRNDVL